MGMLEPQACRSHCAKRCEKAVFSRAIRSFLSAVQVDSAGGFWGLFSCSFSLLRGWTASEYKLLKGPLPYLISAFGLTSFATLFLGVFVSILKWKSRISTVFLLYSLSIAWWSFLQILLMTSSTRANAIMWARFMEAGPHNGVGPCGAGHEQDLEKTPPGDAQGVEKEDRADTALPFQNGDEHAKEQSCKGSEPKGGDEIREGPFKEFIFRGGPAS